MSKWTFDDGTETYTVPINPDSMTSPVPNRELRLARSHFTGGDTRIRAFQQVPAMTGWQFSGVIRTQAHHDALVAWAEKEVPIDITDHIGRTFRVVINSFEVTDRKPTPSVPWRLRYTMKTILLEEL